MSQPVAVPTAQDPKRIQILKQLEKNKDTEIDSAYVKRAEADVAAKKRTAQADDE